MVKIILLELCYEKFSLWKAHVMLYFKG